MYENERESIEAQYREAKEQVVQRLLGAMEDRRRKLREEKEGGEVISGMCPFYYFHHHFPSPSFIQILPSNSSSEVDVISNSLGTGSYGVCYVERG